jgi:hypothetical protein
MLRTQNESSKEPQKVSNMEQPTNITEADQLENCYVNASLQLIDICYMLYAKSASIFREWEAASNIPAATQNGSQYTSTWLWSHSWRPLLQVLARLSCDCRRRVRARAFETLGVFTIF